MSLLQYFGQGLLNLGEALANGGAQRIEPLGVGPYRIGKVGCVAHPSILACSGPPPEAKVRALLGPRAAPLLLGMLYTADPCHPLPCGCPSWKAEVFDTIGRKVQRVLRVDPAEGWADVHRADESGNVEVDQEGSPVVERVEGFFLVRCPAHPERLLT